MKSETNMNAAEGLVNLTPTEQLEIVGRLTIGMPLYSSNADNLVHHDTTNFLISARSLVFCRTKLCDPRFLEGAYGKPLESEVPWNADGIPITL